MLRFVPLTDYVDCPADATEAAACLPSCGIFDTCTDRFLECGGSHLLHDLGEVWDAAGERGCDLVPDTFFPRGADLGAAAPGFAEYMAKRRRATK